MYRDQLRHLPKHRTSASRMRRRLRAGNSVEAPIENNSNDTLNAVRRENENLTAKNELFDKIANFSKENEVLLRMFQETGLNEEKHINTIKSIHQQFELFHEIQNNRKTLSDAELEEFFATLKPKFDTELENLFAILILAYNFLTKGERNQYLSFLQETIGLFKKFDSDNLSEKATSRMQRLEIIFFEAKRKDWAAKKLQKFYHDCHNLGLFNKSTITSDHSPPPKRARLKK